MGTYTDTGPFVNGSAPGISAAFLNNVETCISNGGMIYLTNPNNILSSVSFSSGQVQSFTAWGTGGVPTNAIAVLLGANCTSSTVGMNATFFPFGAVTGQYFACGNVQVTGGFANVFGIVPLDLSAGRFSVKSNSAASTISAWMFGYVM